MKTFFGLNYLFAVTITVYNDTLWIYFYKNLYVYFVQDYYNSSEIESEPEGLDYITNLFTVESQVLRQKIRLLVTDLFNFPYF